MSRTRTILAAALLAAAALPPAAGAYADRKVAATAAYEYTVFGGGPYVGYSQTVANDPANQNVWLKAVGRARVRVNANRTSGDGGGIDGTLVVYGERPLQTFPFQPSTHAVRLVTSEWRIRIYHADTRRRETLPNKPGSETHPTISGNRILFTRTTARGTFVILYDRGTRKEKVLARGGLSGRLVTAGQVNGDWAVWELSLPAGTTVFRYHVSTGESFKVPKPKGYDTYGPSVTADGTVYFGASKTGTCLGTRYMQLRRGRTAKVLMKFPRDVYLGPSYAVAGDYGATLFHSRTSCRTFNWDAYRVEFSPYG